MESETRFSPKHSRAQSGRFEAEYIHADIGWDCWCREGNALPQRTVDLLAKHKLGLFGAITSKPKKQAEAELSAGTARERLLVLQPYRHHAAALSSRYLHAPCISFPGNPLNFIRKSATAASKNHWSTWSCSGRTPKVSMPASNGPIRPSRFALRSRRMPSSSHLPMLPDRTLQSRCASLLATPRDKICKAAFEWARKYGYKSVTICEKPNVLRETSGMMEDEAKAVAKEYPGISLWSTNIDAQTMWLTKNPEEYGVVVASNLFGDVISDAFAGLIGGLGFAASGNIGDEVAVFEPTHGSAPKYAELDPPIVNPIAMFLSAVMMLEHIGEVEKASRIREAIAAVVEAKAKFERMT